MVLRLPRTSLEMVGRAASRCTGCHHSHYHHSSKMLRTLAKIQRTKSQTCRVLSIYIPRPAETDSQQLQQTWCERKFFLTSGYQIQPAPSPTKWIGKQTGASSSERRRGGGLSLTEQHRKSKLRTNDTIQPQVRFTLT